MNAILIESRRALVAGPAEFLALLGCWRQRVQGRRRLAALDDRLLEDVGLTRVQALHESSKPFWVA